MKEKYNFNFVNGDKYDDYFKNEKEKGKRIYIVQVGINMCFENDVKGRESPFYAILEIAKFCDLNDVKLLCVFDKLCKSSEVKINKY